MSAGSQQSIEGALAIAARVVRAMVKHPECVKFKVAESRCAVSIEIVAHPNDTRRIVGSQGSNLGALSSLTRLLVHGQGVVVSYGRVTPNGDAEEPRTKFEPDPHWPRQDIINLISDVTEAVFPDKKVIVSAGDYPDSRTVVNVAVLDYDGAAVDRFALAIAKLFKSIGNVKGRTLEVVVNESVPTERVL